MKQGIVICSWSGGREWLDQCLKSLEGCKYPITVIINDAGNADPHWIEAIKHNVGLINEDTYEVGAIQAGHQVYDEFFFLQDTCQIKNLEIFDIIFQEYKGKSIQWGYKFQSYLGKFRKEILDQIEFPMVRTKTDAIANETDFLNKYLELDPETVVLFPMFSDFTGHQISYLGRNNLMIENEYLIKWKGYWVG
jgi:hypothetical protein